MWVVEGCAPAVSGEHFQGRPPNPAACRTSTLSQHNMHLIQDIIESDHPGVERT